MKKLLYIFLLLSCTTFAQDRQYLVFDNFAQANEKQNFITFTCKMNGVFDANTQRLCFVQKNSDSTLFNIVYDVKRTKGFGYDFNDYHSAISREALIQLDSIWIDIK
jgi:hypothetical protein